MVIVVASADKLYLGSEVVVEDSDAWVSDMCAHYVVCRVEYEWWFLLRIWLVDRLVLSNCVSAEVLKDFVCV